MSELDVTNPGPVGVIGLGNMGRPVAVNLAAAGVRVLAWNRRDSGLSETERDPAGPGTLTLVGDLAELARECAVVLCLLPDLPMLAPLLPELTGAESALEVLVVMGTVSPVGVAQLAADLAPGGIEVVDAPMSGGVRGAQQATMSILVGGSDEAVARVRPVLEAVGGTVTRLGPVGSGSLAKACNQLVVAGTLAALSEAMILAERGGLDRSAVLDLLGAGMAASEVLEQKRDALARDDFTPTGAARYMLKDLGFARAAAQAQGSRLPQLDTLAAVFERLVADGLGDRDVAVVLEALRTISR